MPTGYAVSAKPTAATLEYEGLGKRSGTRPFFGLAVSQKKWNVRCWRSTRNGSTTGLVPVLAGDEYDHTSFRTSPARLDENSTSRIALVAISAMTRRWRCDIRGDVGYISRRD